MWSALSSLLDNSLLYALLCITTSLVLLHSLLQLSHTMRDVIPQATPSHTCCNLIGSACQACSGTSNLIGSACQACLITSNLIGSVDASTQVGDDSLTDTKNFARREFGVSNVGKNDLLDYQVSQSASNTAQTTCDAADRNVSPNDALRQVSPSSHKEERTKPTSNCMLGNHQCRESPEEERGHFEKGSTLAFGSDDKRSCQCDGRREEKSETKKKRKRIGSAAVSHDEGPINLEDPSETQLETVKQQLKKSHAEIERLSSLNASLRDRLATFVIILI